MSVQTTSGADFSTVVADVMDISPADVRDETGPGTDARWTSLKHVELVVAVQEVYGIILSHQEILDLRSVAAGREILRRRGVVN